MGRWAKDQADPDAYQRQLAHARAWKHRNRPGQTTYKRHARNGEQATCPHGYIYLGCCATCSGTGRV